eukprot:102267-Pelagomonas_calceolata.AAC.2
MSGANHCLHACTILFLVLVIKHASKQADRQINIQIKRQTRKKSPQTDKETKQLADTEHDAAFMLHICLSHTLLCSSACTDRDKQKLAHASDLVTICRALCSAAQLAQMWTDRTCLTKNASGAVEAALAPRSSLWSTTLRCA